MTYNKFINGILNSRGQWDIPEDGIWENHHIIPRCKGGLPVNISHDTIHENLIWLTPEEHYIAHKLLFEENLDDRGLGYSWFMLSQNNKIDTPEEYGRLRREYDKINRENNSGENNPNYGKVWSEEERKALSESRKGKYMGEKSPMYGKRGELNPNYGRHHTEETKFKISQANLGENNPMYGKPGTRLGAKNSESTNKRISEAQSIKVRDISTGKIYNSMSEAAEDIGYCVSSVSKAIKNNKSLKGHIFERVLF